MSEVTVTRDNFPVTYDQLMNPLLRALSAKRLSILHVLETRCISKPSADIGSPYYAQDGP